jgi:hypothetical protein
LLNPQLVVADVLGEFLVSEGVSGESMVSNLLGGVNEDLKGSIVPAEELVVLIREWGLGVIEVSTLSSIYLAYVGPVTGLVSISECCNSFIW